METSLTLASEMLEFFSDISMDVKGLNTMITGENHLFGVVSEAAAATSPDPWPEKHLDFVAFK